MKDALSANIKRLRNEKGLSQQQLADMLFVDRSTVTYWETGRRAPDAKMMPRIAKALGTTITALYDAPEPEEAPNVILVDDEKIILSGGLPILESAMPGAVVTGFSRASDAVDFAKSHPVSIAFLDIELGKSSGIYLARELMAINDRTNVIFLTAYLDYSLAAWEVGASGFLSKPLTLESVLKQLSILRYPVKGLFRK